LWAGGLSSKENLLSSKLNRLRKILKNKRRVKRRKRIRRRRKIKGRIEKGNTLKHSMNILMIVRGLNKEMFNKR
jgi:hypothetical protein